MSSLRLLKTLVTERLTAAAVEILELVERVMVEQEAELIRQYRPAEVKRYPGTEASHSSGDTDAQWEGADHQLQVKEEQPEPLIIKQEQEEVWSAPPVQDGAPRMAVEQDSEVLMHSVECQVDPAPCEEALKVEPQDDDGLPSTSSELTDAPAPQLDPPPDTDSSGTSCCCKVCRMPFSYRSLSSLMKHAEVHADEERCLCGVCGKLLPNRDSLLEHLQTHIKIHGCHICGKTFQQYSERVAHTRSHKSKKPFSCSDCGKGFKITSSLIRHFRMHKNHMKHHPEEQPNCCRQCSRCFSDISMLRRHMKTHKKDKT